MKKKTLLLLPLTFLLASCQFNIFGIDFRLFEKKENNSQNTQEEKKEDIPDVDPEIYTHATSVSADPRAAFYLNVGEERQLKMTLSPTPTKDDEKIFEWNLVGDAVTLNVDETNTAKATVVGNKVGHAEITATNTYNDDFKKTFVIEVIEFDEERDYLWQYNGDDKAQFGYTSETKAGDKEGYAFLNGMMWKFERSSAVTINTSTSGYIGFGRGKEPETNLHFELENNREVSRIEIEAGSANGLANLSVHVGETTFINKSVPKIDATQINPIVSSGVDATRGKISIDVVTPEYDPSRADDPTYYAPGAFSLKSIRIMFTEKQDNITATLVKSADVIVEGGNYLIVGESSGSCYCLDGSITSNVRTNPLLLSDFSISDENIVVPSLYKSGFKAVVRNGLLDFISTTNVKIGLATSNISVTTSAKFVGWSYEVDESGHFNMSKVVPATDDTQEDKIFYLAFSSTSFKSASVKQSNIYLFKF